MDKSYNEYAPKHPLDPPAMMPHPCVVSDVDLRRQITAAVSAALWANEESDGDGFDAVKVVVAAVLAVPAVAAALRLVVAVQSLQTYPTVGDLSDMRERDGIDTSNLDDVWYDGNSIGFGQASNNLIAALHAVLAGTT